MESLRISQRRQCLERKPTTRTQVVGNFGTCIKKSPDKPNVSESQRIFRERCKSVLDGKTRDVHSGPTIYTTVETTKASLTTLMLKDTITATTPRFAEFITPRPPPNYYFFGSTIQISMAGDSKAPNHVCGPGEIKRVG